MLNDSGSQLDLDILKDVWAEAAGFAWWGFNAHGRGAMLVDLEIETNDLTDELTSIGWSFRYIFGTDSSNNSPKMNQNYDPRKEIVFFVRRQDDSLSCYVLALSPSPPDAAAKAADPHLSPVITV